MPPKTAAPNGFDIMSKSPGLVVNKAAEIRRVASALVAEGELPRPKTIRERLGRKGIVVTSQQVSMALANTEFAYRRIQVDQRHPPVLFPDPTLALSKVSFEELEETREFVRKLGSAEKALVAISIIGKLKQTEPEENENNRPKPTQ
jgi:hypothetical protein